MRSARLLNPTDVFGRSYMGPQRTMADGSSSARFPDFARLTSNGELQGWMSEEAYVQRPVIPFVLDTPKIFDLLADDKLGHALKEVWIEIMTVQPIKIEGLQYNITASVEERPISFSGHKLQQVVKTSVEQGELTYTLYDKPTKPLTRFVDFMVRYVNVDPMTQSNLLRALKLKEGALEKIGNAMDWATGTMLYIETDMSNRFVTEAFIAYNVGFTDAVPITGSMDLETGNKLADPVELKFTSIQYVSDAVRQEAQAIVDNMEILTKAPDAMVTGSRPEEVMAADKAAPGYKTDNTTANPQQTVGDPANFQVSTIFG